MLGIRRKRERKKEGRRLLVTMLYLNSVCNMGIKLIRSNNKKLILTVSNKYINNSNKNEK